MSEVVCVLFASVFTSKVSQFCVPKRTLGETQQRTEIKSGIYLDKVNP